MQTSVNIKNGDVLSILGFGCMRFPTKSGGIDEPRAIKMIHNAIQSGVNYFDTAYIYHGGKSESLLGKALVGGIREKVKIATKLPPFMVNKVDNAKKYLQHSFQDYKLIILITIFFKRCRCIENLFR